ncbi:Kinesin-like protein kif1b, partial [Cladochytrium tenue]
MPPLPPAAADGDDAHVGGGGGGPAAASSKVQVHVRIRPLNARELALASSIILKETSSPDTLSIHRPPAAGGGGGSNGVVSPSASLSPASVASAVSSGASGGVLTAIGPGAPVSGRTSGDRSSVMSSVSILSSTSSTIAGGPGGGGGGEEDVKTFTFDAVFWSCFPEAPTCASQEDVYDSIGRGLLDHAFAGYNVCLFAYGQTGSGKSYTMMGSPSNRGVIPRVCEEVRFTIILSRIQSVTDPDSSFEVAIYNERVRDLLNPANKNNLRVREHPQLGPYVEDLSKLVVTSFESVERLMDIGNKARIVASTNMNETSSRSHAIFSLVLTQSRTESTAKSGDDATSSARLPPIPPTTPPPGAAAGSHRTERVSRISLVDLAGSERADATGAKGVRLKEGSAINRSLTALGKVISALAEADNGTSSGSSSGASGTHDSLGGNSKTVMLAALSPSDVNYDETLSTLRFAERAKRIETRAVVNEDETGRSVRLLKEEVARLKARLANYETVAEPRRSPVPGGVHPGGPSRGTDGEDDRLGPHLSRAASLSLPATPTPGVSDESLDLRAMSTLGRTLGAESLKRPRSMNNLNPERVPSQVHFQADLPMDVEALRDQLRANEKLIRELTSSFKDKLEMSERIARQDLAYLEGNSSGRSSPADFSGAVSGVQVPRTMPHLINLIDDLLPSECVLYRLPPGTHVVGSGVNAAIRLEGDDIRDLHATFECVVVPAVDGGGPVHHSPSPTDVAGESAANSAPARVAVTLHPQAGGVTMVDGTRLESTARLASGARIAFGDYHLFRFSNPSEPPVPSVRRWRLASGSPGSGENSPVAMRTTTMYDARSLTFAALPSEKSMASGDSTPAQRRGSQGQPSGGGSGEPDAASLASWSSQHSGSDLAWPRQRLPLSGEGSGPQPGESGATAEVAGAAETGSSPPAPVDPQTSVAVLSAAAAQLRATLIMDLEARLRIAQALGGGSEEGSTVEAIVPAGAPPASPSMDAAPPPSPRGAPNWASAIAADSRLSWLLDPSALTPLVPLPPVQHAGAVGGGVGGASDATAAKTAAVTASRESEVEERVRVLEADLAQEKEKMRRILEVQRQNYEGKLRRLQAKRGGSSVGGDVLSSRLPSSPVGSIADEWTDRQRALAFEVCRQWRWRCIVKLGEDVLRYAGLLKEANIIARELGKNVLYQVVILDDASHLNPISFWESHSSDFSNRPPSSLGISNVATSSAGADVPRTRPVAAVRVLDGKHNSVHHWPLSALAVRVPLMRAQYEVTDMAASFYVHRRSAASDGCFYDVAGPADEPPPLSSALGAVLSASTPTTSAPSPGRRPPLPVAEASGASLGSGGGTAASPFSGIRLPFFSPATPPLPPPLPPGIMVGTSPAAGAAPAAATSRRRPHYELIGSASVGVRGLGIGVARESHSPVTDPATSEIRGWLRVVISPISSEPPLREEDEEDVDEDDEDDDDDDGGLLDFSAVASKSHTRKPSLTEVFSRNIERRNSAALAAVIGDDRPDSYLQDGGTVVFEVSILELSGLSESEFTQVHCQFRASQFESLRDSVSPSDSLQPRMETSVARRSLVPGTWSARSGEWLVPNEMRVLATHPTSDFGAGQVRWEFSQTLTIRVSAGLREVVRRGLVRFDVFGRRRRPVSEAIRAVYASVPPALEAGSLEYGWQGLPARTPSSTNSNRRGAAPAAVPATLARTQTATSAHAIAARHRQIVLSQVEIAEPVSSTGDFQGVPVQSVVSASSAESKTGAPVPGSHQFLLRQGLQRRITLRLSHAAGHTGLPWRRVSYLRIGRIRRVQVRTNRPLDEDLDESQPYSGFVELALPAAEDGDGGGPSSSASVVSEQALPENRPVVTSDGRSRLEVSVPWDSSLHGCPHLNRPCGRGVRLELTIAWGVEVDAICDEGDRAFESREERDEANTRGGRRGGGRARSSSVSSTDSDRSIGDASAGDGTTRWLLFGGPVHFEATVGVIVHERDARLRGASARFVELLAASGISVAGVRYHDVLSLLHEVRLTPTSPMSAVVGGEDAAAADVDGGGSPDRGLGPAPRPVGRRRSWRGVDTRGRYVRGEESLGGWQPSGQGVVMQYWSGRARRKLLDEVQAWRQRLDEVGTEAAAAAGGVGGGSVGLGGLPPVPVPAPPAVAAAASVVAGGSLSERDQFALLRKCVELWRRPSWGRDPSFDRLLFPAPAAPAEGLEEEPVLWMKPWCKPISRIRSPSMKGWLYTPNERGSWVRRYFVLRRPCLHVYERATDLDEVAVFGLRESLVEYGAALGSIGQ